MKPNGLSISADATMRVVTPSTAEDAVWEAVEKALEHGWTVSQFINEARSAWRHVLSEQAKHAMNEFDRASR